MIVTVNMEIARNIHRDRIRAARISALARLDVAFVRALENGDDTASIVSAKQELRDAPAHSDIESALTPGELMAVWNPLLGPSPYVR